MDRIEPRSANDYDDRTTAAVKCVLVEIGQILGSFEGKFAVIGGAVPWLLLKEAEMPHVGTADVDLALHAEALGDGEYARLVDMLRSHGYRQSPNLRRFQLARTVTANAGGPSIEVIVDFLMPREAVIAKNKPPLVDDFAVQRADGAELALKFYRMVAIDGGMPDGGRNRVCIAVGNPFTSRGLVRRATIRSKDRKSHDSGEAIMGRGGIGMVERTGAAHFGEEVT